MSLNECLSLANQHQTCLEPRTTPPIVHPNHLNIIINTKDPESEKDCVFRNEAGFN